MSFADRLKEIRKKKSLSQKALAEKSGLSIATIQGYEQGKYEPKSDTLLKLASALDVVYWYNHENGEPYFYEFCDTPQELSIEEQERQKEQLEAVKQWRSAKEQKEQLNKNFDAVNDIGKQKIVDYSEDIKDKYKK